MTEEQQELYDIVSDWWGDAETQDKDPIIADLVNAIMDWKDPPQQHPVEGFE